jgi:hypothetical protein
VDRLQKLHRISGSWLPHGVNDITPVSYDSPDFGWALFQLMVQNIDSRAGAKSADMIATLAYLAGRILQRATFRESPQDFRIDLSANGVAILRNDYVSERLTLLTPGTLASTLTEAALVSGARRFPEISKVRQEAQEAMLRRGAADLRGGELSASPRELARQVQEDVDDLLADPANRLALVRAAFSACGFAVGYNRSRLCPAAAAELGLSIALYASWVDQRSQPRKPQ